MSQFPRTPSEKTFQCFTCRDRGFPEVLIRLAGKDEKGKTVQVELDGETLHVHKGSGKPAAGQKTISTVQTTTAATDAKINDIQASLDYMNRKMDHIISILESNPLNDDGDSSRESPEHDPNF
jgi:hypothetical protein